MKFDLFLKSRLLFNIFYCFCMFKKKIRISRVRISEKVNSIILRNLRCNFFYMKTKILVDFYICVSVPLSFTNNLNG